MPNVYCLLMPTAVMRSLYVFEPAESYKDPRSFSLNTLQYYPDPLVRSSMSVDPLVV